MAIPNRKKLAEYFAQLRRVEKSRSAKAEKNIQLIYKEMLKNLREFLGVQYAKYAEDDALTYSALASKGRYARFLEEVQQQVDGIIPKVNREITSTVTEMYDTAYQGMVRAVSRSANNKELEERLKGLTLTRPEVIKAATTNPVAGLTLSSTLEENRKKIIYDINKNVTIGIMNGDRMSTMANRIKSSVDENYRKAMLIARTEVHRVRETGHNDAAMDIDNALSSSTEYRLVKTWKNMQDNAVRRTELANHWVMEGKTVLMDEEFDLGNGVFAPCPGQSGTAYNDCNCRCYLSHDLVSDAEFFELTGRHFQNVTVPVKIQRRPPRNTESTVEQDTTSTIEQLQEETSTQSLAERRRERMTSRNRQLTENYDFDSMNREQLSSFLENNLQTQIGETKGVNVDFLKETAKAISKFENKMGGSIENLKIEFGGVRANAYAHYEESTSTLHLKKTGSLEKFAEMTRKENEKAIRKLGKSYHATETYEGTIYHELGHAVDHSVQQSLSRALSTPDEFRNAAKISVYAGSQPAIGAPRASEAFAENFAAYMEGGKSAERVPQEIKDMIDEYFKNHKKR